MTDVAFDAAMKTFMTARGNSTQCLRLAIETYKRVSAESYAALSGLEMELAHTDKGPDTALVIFGFKNADEAEAFATRLYASGK